MPIQRIKPHVLNERRRERRADRAAAQEQWLHWLVDFVQVSIRDLPAVARRELQEKVAEFSHVRLSGTLPMPPVANARIQLNLRELLSMQRQLRAICEKLWTRDPDSARTYPFVRVELGYSTVHLTPIGSSGRIGFMIEAEWPARFWWTVVKLFELHGSRIRRCISRQKSMRCGRLFVRTRRQMFCSKTCARRELARRWYELHRNEAQRRRRAAYANKKAVVRRNNDSVS
ncbi:MAG: hypothetical protein C5B57_10520 [Blastocatellia bacterium]|nr:MAG: hypothetical protein C5B57_10520 [Blastocatellia bacterium]